MSIFMASALSRCVNCTNNWNWTLNKLDDAICILPKFDSVYIALCYFAYVKTFIVSMECKLTYDYTG